MTSAPPSKRWRLLAHDRHAVDQLARSIQVPALVAQLLLNRGVATPDHARRFLDCPLSGLYAPSLLPGVPEAADRLLAAVAAGRRICVYGDYDVDGVTGSSILLGCLTLLGAKPDLHIPHRLTEGYGLNRDALHKIAADGAAVVVTVDCGIASLAEAEEAKRLGLELIITDHHEMKAELPDAAVLVHPRLPGSTYPFGQLCGAGVALKLAWAMAQKKCGGEKVNEAFKEFLLDAVALAALGVVADVVPLADENRILVKAGLSRLRTKPPLGIDVLREVSKVEADAMRASDIGFKLAPRINAAGRMGQARLAVDLLMATNRTRAVDLARHLDGLNEMRQTLERQSTARAKELIAEGNLADAPALVLADAGWHGGIVGIVAGRLAESYGRPALIVTLPGAKTDGLHAQLAVGSGRSFGGLALNLALEACGDLLVGHGGHAAAAGFRLLPEKLEAFRARFCEVVAGHFPEGPPPPELVLDAEAPLSALTLRVLDDIDRLEPYGAENRRPLFLAGGLRVDGEPRAVGKTGTHLQFRVRQGPTVLKAIGWGMAPRLGELMAEGGACSLVVSPKRNEWQGRTSVDLEVIDFQAGAEA
ncbi:MAG: single-stranded-DNA-specific exonuclease RecJ, partial [Gemmataceae bacterium]